MSTSLAIEANRLTKRFGDVVAVNDVSLNIRKGEIYGFLGLNGAGKTTTIRMLLGMIKPSAGYISLFGKKVQPGQRYDMAASRLYGGDTSCLSRPDCPRESGNCMAFTATEGHPCGGKDYRTNGTDTIY